MKKLIVFAVVLALLVPAAAFAAAEFSLGGFIKLDTMWDSNNTVGKNMNGLPGRNNNGSANHGRLKFTAQGSRFNFTIKGPQLFGAQTTGFIEMDFDSAERANNPSGFSASNNYIPRMRHAMFRFNWPTSELLLGQYFSMFCEWYAESAEDGPLQMTGTPTARLAQIRFTQKFASDWTVAGLIGEPNAIGTNPTPYNININNGQSSETPQVQGKVQYQHDFWGKAAYYGKPIPFTASFVAGWQRNILRQQNVLTINQFGETGFVPTAVSLRNEYVNPWLLMGSLFIPVLPTHTANLAGTASILTQWWIGRGVEAFGFSGVTSDVYKLNNNFNGFHYDAQLLKKYGGFVEGQYYFTNQWFLNALYAFSKAYGVSRARSAFAPGNGLETGFIGDNAQTIQQVSATLWYRPIQAIKFGLQYSYLAATYLQYATPPAIPNVSPASNVNRSRFGDDHRVEFVGFFYF